jgi:sigma-B regulation protein RsbU (phosphoserine phosphatase)
LRILVAEDQAVARFVLEDTLRSWDYDVVAVADGASAWTALQADDAPKLALLDWEMPGLDGPDICQRVREAATDQPPYLILLTAREKTEDLVAGLRSGANDYLTKPFQEAELAARLSVAVRTLELQRTLADRVRELEDALAQIKVLRGILPICAWCKKVRNDENYWERLEGYLGQHTDLRFTHGMCPECSEREIAAFLRQQVSS